MKQTHYPVGSVISGTMRPEELIPAFYGELYYDAKNKSCGDVSAKERKAHLKLVLEAEEYLERYQDADMTFERKPSCIFSDTHRNTPNAETLSEYVDQLADALEAYAGPYFYFGSHPGDGSDYGFWLSDGFFEEFDGPKVADSSELPKGYRGEYLIVSDHGNLTLCVKSARTDRVVWAVA